ncbi:uncharacterized protein LOC132753345 isoform X4 [Ruditapes philippinarum]|uniref:uncharacterized protein LOC132753345 isoform X4 n=1 Tax=Ruditapes philippinarum TaxID=129788 RepID=UPI00295B8C36|nr:uncharacterized protein LOC132753345 isoform X4 [Ruditapes philippinarum]
MSARTYRNLSMRPGRSARSYRSASTRQFSRPSSSCSLVESNFRVMTPETPIIPEVHITNRSRRQKEITINDAPMMLLPKARVRDSLDYYDNFRRSYSVVADTSVQGLHISTIQSVSGLEKITPQKPALKSRRSSISRSEADSGFCSLKRAVTFENLSHSQSSVYKSDDDLDNLSVSTVDDNLDNDSDDHLPNIQASFGEIPDHLESFSNGDYVLANPPHVPRPPSRSEGYYFSKRRRHGHSEDHDISACEICGVVLSEKDKVQMKFGKVDKFLDWVMSKWGPRKELQYIPRPSYVYRNHTPHFCNFVHQISLHDRQTNVQDSQDLRDMEFDDDVEFIMESAEGRLISKYRKTSNASSNDIEKWLSEKKNNRGLYRNNISSIPEIKEDIIPSGTEGRPGSPSSLDGDSRLEDDNQQPVTGIEVRLSSPIKSDRSDDRRSKAEDLLSSRSGMSIPEEKEDRGDADNHKGAFDNKFKPLTGGESVTVPSSSDSENNNRAESPRQPPPSPEPPKQTKEKSEIPLPTTQPTPKKRGCVTKKTKKPIERTRKMKPIEEPKEAEPVKVEEVPVVDTPSAESDKVDSKIDLKVPDLPTNIEKEKTRKEKTKAKKHLIEHEDDLYRPDPGELLNEQLKQNRAEFDWSNMEQNGIEDIKRPPQIKSWISGRLALSQQASRFELPMDMKKLEKMTPQEYVRKHCIITSRRQNLYQKIFLKNKDKTQVIVYKDLDRSLKDVLVNTITSEQVQDVLNMLNITESTKVDYQLFAGMAAFAERVLYPSFVTQDYLRRLVELEIAFGLLGTDDTREMPEYQREKIECADFSALPWKLHGVKVNSEMRKMLEQIS